MTELVLLTDWAWALGLLGLFSAFGIYGYVKRQPAGTEGMIDLGEQIHDGAMAFLRREYSVLAVFVVIVAVLLGLAHQRGDVSDPFEHVDQTSKLSADPAPVKVRLQAIGRFRALPTRLVSALRQESEGGFSRRDSHRHRRSPRERAMRRSTPRNYSSSRVLKFV